MPPPSPQPPPAPPADRRELDAAAKTGFLLANLLETTRELSGMAQPTRIMDTFLLMLMGPLGLARGLVALSGAGGRQFALVCRGLEPGEEQDLRERLSAAPEFLPAWTGQEGPSGAMAVPLGREGGSRTSFNLPGMRFVVPFRVEPDTQGLLAVGDRVDGLPLARPDLDLLSDFTATLVAALTRALITQDMQQLNAELEKQNDCLEKALAESKTARRDLDQRVFHLKSLYDLTAELSPMVATEELLNAFLLMMMGTFGIGQAMLLIHDRTGGRVWKAQRGQAGQGEETDPGQAEKILFACFALSEQRTLAPMTVSRLAGTEALTPAGWETKGGKGFMFVLDRDCMGALALGPSITGECLRPAEIQTLITYVSTFLVFLKNVRYLETVRELNDSLSRRNQELERTIADLTEARQKITVLERAKAQIKHVIQGESERLRRARPLDFVFLLVATLVLGFFFNLAGPNRIPLLPETALRPPNPQVLAEQARELLEQDKAVLIDARPKELFQRGRIPGALNLPSSLFDIVYLMKLNDLDPQRPIIVYGRHVSRLYDEEVAHQLRRRQHERVFVLAGGLEAWRDKSYPVEP